MKPTNKPSQPSVIENHGRAAVDRNNFLVVFVIVAVWLRGFAPGAINYLTVSHTSGGVTDVIARSQLSQYVSWFTTVVLIVSALLAIAFANTNRNPSMPMVAVLAWLTYNFVYKVILYGFSANEAFDLLCTSMICVALWRLEVKTYHVLLFLVLGLAEISFSMLLGFLSPETAFFPGEEKNIFSNVLLAGNFGHSNALGISCSLLLPLIGLLQSSKLRVLAATLCWAALLWSGSRTGLLSAAGTSLTLVLMFIMKNPKKLKTYIGAISLALVFILPLITSRYEDFTSRGRIWIVSLQHYLQSPVFGLGPSWYQIEGLYASDLGHQAASGHNLMVHVITTTGLIGVLVSGFFLVKTLGGNTSSTRLSSTLGFWRISFFITCITEFILVEAPQTDIFYFCTFALILFSTKPKDSKQPLETT